MPEKNEFNQIVGDSIRNWQPAKRPAKTSMQGSYCILEPLDLNKHTAQLFAALQHENDGSSWTYLPYGPFKTYTEFQTWLSALVSDHDPLLYTILDIRTNMPVGLASYLRIAPEFGSIEVGHLHYSKLLKKSHAATEAMYLMMQKAFEELGYRRYEWKCDSLNQASRRAAERLGFKLEGIFRQDKVVKNRNRDTAWYSVIDKEWPTLKKRFQKWLSPSNFDSNGKQILSLQGIMPS